MYEMLDYYPPRCLFPEGFQLPFASDGLAVVRPASVAMHPGRAARRDRSFRDRRAAPLKAPVKYIL
jgi:hypothetical protein